MTPSPAEEPPRDVSNSFVYIDYDGKPYEIDEYGKRVELSNESMTDLGSLFPVHISLNVLPVYQGFYLSHETTKKVIELPNNQDISLKLPEGKYKLYMKVHDEVFLPKLPKDGEFEVIAESNNVVCEFEDGLLGWFSDLNLEAFRDEDFVYAIGKLIYKETTPKPGYKIDDTDLKVVIRKKNHPETESLISVNFNLGIPASMYGSLFNGFEFIIRSLSEKQSINLTIDDLNQLSMRPGVYILAKRDLDDRSIDPWDGNRITFSISEKSKSIDLGISYEDVLSITGNFLLIQENETQIHPEANRMTGDYYSLKEEQKSDLINHVAEIQMFDAYMDWNEDVDIMMQDEEVQIYLNGNKIEKKRGLLKLSRGEYTIVIKAESTGWKEKIQSQPISLPAEGASNKFTFDNVQLNDIHVKLAEEKVEPEWLFEYKTEYYKVGIGADQNSKTIQINKAKFDEVLEKQGTEKESPVFLSINYSPDLDIPEGLIIKVTPVKTGELKKPLSAGEVLIGQGKLLPDYNVMEESVNVYGKSNEHLENTAPTQEGIEDTQKSSPMEATVSGGRGLPIMSIYLMNKIESLSIELVIPNGGVTKPFTFLLDNKSPNTPVSVTFTNLRKIIKDLSRDANEFILKAKDENERIIPIDTPTDDRSHMYALLQDGKYTLEAVNGEADPVKKDFTIENGIVTVTPEDDNNSSALE